MRSLVLLLSVPLLSGVFACRQEAAQRGAEPQAPRPREPAKAPTAASPDTPLRSPLMVNLDEVTWQDGPDALPAGAQVAVLEGKPPFPAGETFSFVARLPPGYTVPPHVHAVTERVTVLAGSLGFGHGDTLDKQGAKQLEQGGVAIIPPGHPHFVFTGADEAVLLLQGVGPWAISYVNPEDDPRESPPPLPPSPEISYDASVELTVANPRDLEYAPAPEGMLPPGAQLAVLEGKLPFDQQETFLLRIKLPDGYRFWVHTHGVTDRLTVTSGALGFAVGERWDDANLTKLEVGGIAITPADVPHYAEARGDTVIQVWGVGPFDITWLHPEDDPARTRR